MSFRIPAEKGPLKVCITGPECTGKSDLSAFLARHYQTVWVAEYARAYLDQLHRPYEESDLLKIAHGQLRMEDAWRPQAHRLLLCDTNLLTLKIWSEFKFGHCAEEIIHLHRTTPYDLYLLCYIDIPWQDDPQREHPDKRAFFWERYLAGVQETGLPFHEIRGDREQRRKAAIAAIDAKLALH